MKFDSLAMAEKSKDIEHFCLGNQVQLTKITGETIFGEVVTYDPGMNLLMLKIASEEHHGQHYLEFVHMDYVKAFELLDELNNSMPALLPFVSASKVQNRMQQTLEEVKKKKNLVGHNVTPEGQLVMNTIAKTLGEVKWQNDTIIVMDRAMITPPYTIDQLSIIPGISGRDNQQNSALMTHIQKILVKHHEDRKEQLQNDARHSTSTSPSPTSSASSVS